MKILMTKTEQYLCGTELEAENLVEEYKQKEVDEEYALIDRKITEKTTKEGEEYVVTLKCRYKTLAEARDMF